MFLSYYALPTLAIKYINGYSSQALHFFPRDVFFCAIRSKVFIDIKAIGTISWVEFLYHLLCGTLK